MKCKNDGDNNDRENTSPLVKYLLKWFPMIMFNDYSIFWSNAIHWIAYLLLHPPVHLTELCNKDKQKIK